MKAGERIVFEATGEVRTPKIGENFVETASGTLPAGTVSAAYADGLQPRPILRRVSAERVEAERALVEEALRIADLNTRWTGWKIHELRKDLARIEAAEREPRYEAINLCAVMDKKTGEVLDAPKLAARLNGEGR